MHNSLRQLDDYVEAYEIAHESGDPANLVDFAPSPGHPARFETVIELVRVDLEYGWQSGDRKDIDLYQQMFPDILQSGDGLKQVAFEQYRLRRLAGENVPRESYHERYSISTDDWPELPVGDADRSTSTIACDQACLAELSEIDFSLRSRMMDAEHEMPEVGDRFESFDLVGELGRGAFGRVFLARQGDLARRFVALKISLHLSEESQRLAQLQHTHIVPIYSVHRRGSLQAICMPFLGPNTLADILKTFELSRILPNSGQAIVSTIADRSTATLARHIMGDLSFSSAGQFDDPEQGTRGGEAIRRLGNMDYLSATVWIISRVADGLAYAHEHGIVHRDLKPANILLTDDGQPLLLDFNLATQHSSAGTTMALIGGTLPYIGPEHMEALQHGGNVTPQSDVYSLGVVLFQMLTGHLPYPAPRGPFSEIVGKMQRDRQQPAPSARTLNRRVTPGLAAIVQRCLAPDPKRRYVSARELQEDLQRHLDHRPLQHAPDRCVRERFQKWTRRHSQFASATTVALLAIAIVAVLAFVVHTRGKRIAANEARETLHQIETELEAAQTVLNSPFVDNQELGLAVTHTREHLRQRHLPDSPLSALEIPQQLNHQEQQRLRQCTDELIYLLASGLAQQAIRAPDSQQRKRHISEALRWNQLLYEAGECQRDTGRDTGRGTGAIALQRARLLRVAGQPPKEETPEKETPRNKSTMPRADAKAPRMLAFEYAHQDRFAEAASILEQLVQQSPQDYTLWFSLGNCYLSCQRAADAEDCYTAAIALRPTFTLGYEHRGVARLQMKTFNKACRDFDTALRQQPSQISALVNRALAHQQLGSLELAEEDLCAAIDQGATQTRIYFMRSRIRSARGDQAGAADDYREGMRRTPRDELSWIARGVARLTNEPTKALADFRHALELNPQSPSALQNIAHVLAQRLNDQDGAIDALNQLIAAEPANAAALAGRGVLLARQEKRDASLRDARAALATTNNPLIIYQVGCIYAINAETHPPHGHRAVQLVAQALQRDPSLVDIATQDTDLAAIRDDATLGTVLDAAQTLRQAGKPPSTQGD